MYPNNNNYKKDKNENTKEKSKASGEREREEREGKFIFFSFFTSLYDLRKLDHRFSSEQKAKLVYATRATRGHQNLGVSSNSTR